MKNRVILLFVFLFSCTDLFIDAGREPAAAAEKIELKILYAGHPGSDREKDFVQFLKQQFAEVKTGDLEKFKENSSSGYDVVIMDYDGDGFKAPRPNLSRQYKRATVTVGVIGAFICGSQGLKTGYL